MKVSGNLGILIIDDDKSMRASLVELLETIGWRTKAVARATAGLDCLAEFEPDVILSDVRMPGMTGLELLEQLDTDTTPPLVLISAHGDIPMAVKAMQDGAYSFVEKPYDPRRLLHILRHAADQHRLKLTTQQLKDRLAQLSGLDRVYLGRTDEAVALREEIMDLAAPRFPILLLGETGTGKELVARALHDLGSRPDGPFVAINCAAIPSEGFERDMFGVHGGEKGKALAADGGTLFLDEICSCSLANQAKLLRVIETGEIVPYGGYAPIKVDFRVVSATNEDLDAAVEDGRFRKDLQFRLNTATLTMPSLRNCRSDITLLFLHYLEQFAQVYEVTPPALTQDDLTVLMSHDWPGNVRELRNAAERRVFLARRGAGSVAQALSTDPQLDDVPQTLREAVAVFERELIAKAITTHQGRMDAVAEALGIGRRTLNEKIVKLGLDKDALL